MAAASAAGSRGGTSTPLTPSSTISSGPPQRVATVGTPQARACTVESEKPSACELMAYRSRLCMIRGTSSRKPVKCTWSRSPSPSRISSRSRCICPRLSPTTTKR